MATSGAILAACKPQIVEVTKVVEKVVKETVMVEGTPQVVEKVVKETVVQKQVVKETVVVVKDKIHIAWYDWNAGVTDKEIADRTVADFMAENPDIEVELQGAPGGNYYDKLQTVLAAGIAPDVINYQSWLWQPYAKRGVVREITELRERDQWNVPYELAWEDLWAPQLYFRGKLYGQPYNTAPMVMFYLKDPFDEQGIPYPTADWTEQEFRELAEKLTFEKDGVKIYGYYANTSYDRNVCWMRLNGEQEWDSVEEPKTATWLKPTIVEALQWQLYDTVNVLKCSPTPADMQGGANSIQTGNVAMKMEGAWHLPLMQGPKASKEGGVRFDVVTLPKGKSGNPTHMGFAHIQTMNAVTDQVEAAWKLFKFTGDAKCQQHMAEGGRQPNTPEFIEKFWVKLAKEQFGFENTQAFIDAMDTGVIQCTGMSTTPIQLEVFNPFRDALVAGDATAAELLPGVNKALQTMCDEYWAED
jgi:multiple sugar transport system substrate-binding protein